MIFNFKTLWTFLGVQVRCCRRSPRNEVQLDKPPRSLCRSRKQHHWWRHLDQCKVPGRRTVELWCIPIIWMPQPNSKEENMEIFQVAHFLWAPFTMIYIRVAAKALNLATMGVRQMEQHSKMNLAIVSLKVKNGCYWLRLEVRCTAFQTITAMGWEPLVTSSNEVVKETAKLMPARPGIEQPCDLFQLCVKSTSRRVARIILQQANNKDHHCTSEHHLSKRSTGNIGEQHLMHVFSETFGCVVPVQVKISNLNGAKMMSFLDRCWLTQRNRCRSHCQHCLPNTPLTQKMFVAKSKAQNKENTSHAAQNTAGG